MLRSAILLVLVFCGGCSDPYGDYLGYWELEGGEGMNIVQISSESGNILLHDNILREKDFFGNPNKPHVLSTSEGQLVMNLGLGSSALGLSEDKTILRVGGRAFHRVGLERVEEVRAERQKKAEENTRRGISNDPYKDFVNSVKERSK